VAKTKETTVCDQPSMLGITIMLADIMQQLQNAKETIADSYEGEAKEEMELFFGSLPMHIERLTLFYGKMEEYVWTTAESFMKNDRMMCENMEGK
jgi:hypothetical protein